jgi:hypothetical protein
MTATRRGIGNAMPSANHGIDEATLSSARTESSRI